MKSSKYTLLDKTQVYKEEFEINQNVNKEEYSKQRDVAYSRLMDDIEQKDFEKQSRPQNLSTKSTNSNLGSKFGQMNSNHHSSIQPITYGISAPQNSVVHISSSGIAVQPKIPYIPQVYFQDQLRIIDCSKCSVKQQILGHLHEFICYGCHEKESVQPKYGMFICGVCRNHVSYEFKTSHHIQCNYCFTVNKVPFEPFKKEKVSIPKEKLESQPILPKQLRQDIQIQLVQSADVTTNHGQKHEESEQL